METQNLVQSDTGKDLAKLVEKWSLVVPFPALSENKAKAIAIILENQEKHLNDLHENTGGALENCIGDDFRAKIFHGIAQAAFRSDIWDLVSVQPMMNCVSKLFYFERAMSNADPSMPEVRINIRSKDANAITRRHKCSFCHVENKYGRDSMQDHVDTVFVKLFNELRQEILNDLLTAAKNTGPEVSAKHLLGAVMNASIEVHKSTMRGPANKIICHPKHRNVLSLLDDRFKIYSDWQFPENKVLLFYSGASILDQPYVFAPYRFGFWPMSIDNVDAPISIVSRHAKYLVCQEAIIAISIED